ncbi:MAG: FeoC-like transcriptional regulator [Bacillota bacterium]
MRPLRRLLAAVAEQKAISSAELARQLGVSQDSLRLMLRQLNAIGLVAPAPATPAAPAGKGSRPCDLAPPRSGCGACPMASSCRPGSGRAARGGAGGPASAWMLTEQGRRLAALLGPQPA